MNPLLVTLGTVLSSIAIWSVVCVVNHMNSRTPFLRRLAFILLGTGAAGMLIAPFYLQRTPTASEFLLLLALNLLAYTERARVHAMKLHADAKKAVH